MRQTNSAVAHGRNIRKKQGSSEHAQQDWKRQAHGASKSGNTEIFPYKLLCGNNSYLLLLSAFATPTQVEEIRREMLLASSEAALDVLESGLRSAAPRRLANSGVMRTRSSVERAICWKCWVQEEPPDCLYPVKTSRRSVVVPRECKARDFVRCF